MGEGGRERDRENLPHQPSLHCQRSYRALSGVNHITMRGWSMPPPSLASGGGSRTERFPQSLPCSSFSCTIVVSAALKTSLVAGTGILPTRTFLIREGGVELRNTGAAGEYGPSWKEAGVPLPIQVHQQAEDFNRAKMPRLQ